MDRNTVIGLLLIFAIFIGFTIYNQPSEEERAEMYRNDSIARVQEFRADSMAAARTRSTVTQDEVAEIETLSGEPIPASELHDRLGAFANAGVGEDKEYILESDLLKIRVSSKGGKIINVELKKYQSYDSLPLVLYNNDDVNFGYTFFSNNRTINTNNLYFRPYYKGMEWTGDRPFKVTGTENLSFSMRLYTDAGNGIIDESRYIEYVYTLYGDKYMMDYKLNLVGMNQVIDQGTSFLDLKWDAEIRRQEKSLDNERAESTIYYKYFEDDVDYLSETKDAEESLKTDVRWLSFKSRFFASTLIGDEPFMNADIKAFNDEQKTGEHYLRSMSALIGVPFANVPQQTFPMRMYFGPTKYRTLKKYDLELQRQIPLGWSFFLMAWINIYAVIPVFDWLGGYGWNYGIVILLLTIMLKLVLFPIAYKTYKSSAKMRVLKPEIDEIGKKFPKSEDAMKKQQATMALYKKAGVNPMAGCVPMLLQFPILIAMFRFFPSSIELRQQSFLWAHDLSSYDSILSLPWNIPFYGDHVSLFTLLMTISTIMYTKINNDMMGATSNQMPGMKTMMYIMPVMFLGIFNNYASGLSYYYLLANLFTFGQMYLIRQTIDEDKILRQIQLNKTKPVKKKSGFQKRLEDMAKQRGYDAKTGKKR
jgi:YidC/Oxa1 family membrane protein insertase